MRIVSLLFVVAFFTQSCQFYRAYPDERGSALTELTFPPHNRNIELFFAGESTPARDYIRLAVVKESQLATATAPGRLLRLMQKRAQELGADALIIMGAEDNEAINHDIQTDAVINSIPRERMWGLAIRYIDSLEQLQPGLSHLTVTPRGSVASDSSGVIKLNAYGGLNERLSNKWAQFAYDHSLEYLLRQKDNWQYTNLDPNFGYVRTVERRNVNNNQILSRVEVNYRQLGRPVNLRVNLLNGSYERITMNIRYDESGRVTGREWIDATRRKYRTQRVYAADGRLLREDIEREWPGESSLPFLSIQYHYLSEEVMRARLEQEQIVRVKP